MNRNFTNLLCYAFGIISGIVFLVLEPYKNDQETRFNAWQSILFAGTGFVLMFVLNMFSSMVFNLWFISLPLSFAMLGMWVFLMVRSYQGNAYRIPKIAEYADRFAAKQ